MRNDANRETVMDLRDLAAEVYDLLDQMRETLAGNPEALNRAEAYWLAHIDGALENRRGYLGGSFISMEDTILELEEIEEECPDDCDNCGRCDA